MSTIEPPPAFFIAGTTAWMPLKAPVRLTATIFSQPAGDYWSIGAAPAMPALFRSTSSLPSLSTAVATAAVHSSALVTSRWTYVAGGPIF
jgi:hypothetical protein